MRLWAEERRTGTMELLLTLPITMWQAVVGKFLAAWAFIGIALFLTFPIWITVNYLGSPDNGVIFASYVGSFLMAGGYLAIGVVHLGVHAQSGDRVHPQRGRVFPVSAGRILRWCSTSFNAWAPPGRRRCDVVVQLPHAFLVDQQGRDRSARSDLFLANHRVLAVCQCCRH